MEALTIQQEYERQARNQFLLYIAFVVSLTVLIFDHVLTISSEIEYIWRKKMTPFSVLFLVNRYFAATTMSAYFALHFHVQLIDGCGRSGCLGAPLLIFGFTVVTVLIAEAMITLRVYAVYLHNKLVLGLLTSIWIVHLVLMVWLFWRELSSDSIRLAFVPAVTFSKSAGILFIIPAVIFDTVAGAFLTLGLYRKSGKYGKRMPLMKLIIRDGLLYFAVIVITNIFWILVHVLEYRRMVMGAIEFTPLEIWSGCITTTMIGRLTLNLRMYDPAANNELTFQTMGMRFRNSLRRISTVDPDETLDPSEESI